MFTLQLGLMAHCRQLRIVVDILRRLHGGRDADLTFLAGLIKFLISRKVTPKGEDSPRQCWQLGGLGVYEEENKVMKLERIWGR